MPAIHCTVLIEHQVGAIAALERQVVVGEHPVDRQSFLMN